MHLGIGKTEARENVVWQGGGRRRADARQGRQRSPRPILAAKLYRFSSVSTISVISVFSPRNGRKYRRRRYACGGTVPFTLLLCIACQVFQHLERIV